MISVSDAFSVEETDVTRRIAHGLQMAWKKDYRAGVTLFTIGVSTIGGNDLIAGPAGVQSEWNRYLYEDESAYSLGYAYERELSMPLGGLTKALAEADLSNTSGRFTPRHMGGSSALYTAVAHPRRPMVINAGFEVNGVPQTVPQFVGLTTRPPQIDTRRKEVRLVGEDFIGFIQNSYVDKSAMFTSQLSGAVIEDALSQLGFSTAQYDIDPGINIVKFGLFETGAKWGNLVNSIVQAENGHLYQDEEGVIRFEDRQHWTQFPYYNVQRVITTSQVINARSPNYDHIVNVVEVTAKPRDVLATQLIWQTNAYAGAGVIEVPANSTAEVWANYNDPVYNVDTPIRYVPTATSYFIANSLTDGTGTDVTNSVTLNSITNFAQASKMVFSNSSSSPVFLTDINIWGRPARQTGAIYYKGKVGASITAYEEHILKIENDYIQDASWAQSYAEMILADFAYPENLQEITIRAIPELQMGDLVSWQGRYWRVYGIRTMIDPSSGFLQDLKLLQRTITTYFRIGVSTIGGADVIAP